MKTNLVIDGNNLANCAYFKSGFEDENWTPQWACDLFEKMIERLKREFYTDYVYIAWDGRRGADWRKEILPEYKADRKKEGREKLIESIELCKTLQYNNFCLDDFEGDDMILGLCKCFHKQDDYTIIVSADKDFLHLVQRNVADKLYNPLTKSYREIPEIDNVVMRAIAGNDDNLKGCPNKGPKFVEKYVKGLASLTPEEQVIFEKHKLVVDLELNPYKQKCIDYINNLTN
jgi:5'-3' exonuclease